MFFHRITIPGLAIHSYLVGDEGSKECAAIDPARDADLYIDFAESHGFQITRILETHVHADFVSGALEIKTRLHGKPEIYCSGMGGKEWIPSYADHIVKDGDEVKMGALTFRAVHTPGHTPEHVMWALYDHGELKRIFSGDLLFVGDVGRPDLLGKEEMKRLSHQLYESVFQKLKPFPDNAEIRPAHGAGSLCGKELGSNPVSTLGAERKTNKALKMLPEEIWTKELMREMPPAPKYFPRMKKINVVGPKVLGDKLPGNRPMRPAEFQEEISKGALVIDFRSKEHFSEAHIAGSINIPYRQEAVIWAGWVLPENPALILVLDDEGQLDFVQRSLVRIGFDRILGFLRGGMEAWMKAGLETCLSHAVTADELFHLKERGEVPFILDVRTDREWQEGHIDGATHLFGGVVQDNLEALPKDVPITVICGSGFRASVVASVLQREGFRGVTNVFGGMSDWKKAGHPTVR